MYKAVIKTGYRARKAGITGRKAMLIRNVLGIGNPQTRIHTRPKF